MSSFSSYNSFPALILALIANECNPDASDMLVL